MAYITSKDIDLKLLEIKKKFNSDNVLPVSILHPVTFFKDEFDLDITLISKHRVKKIQHMYELFLSALSETVRRSWCKIQNIKVIENRLMVQVKKYGVLKPVFQEWVRDNVSYKYGLILHGEVPKTIVNTIDLSSVDGVQEIQSYLLRGFVIKHDQQNDAETEFTLPDIIEEYTNGDLSVGVHNYMPRGGLFGHFWKPLESIVTNEQTELGSIYKTYGLLQACFRLYLHNDNVSSVTPNVGIKARSTYITMGRKFATDLYIDVDLKLIKEERILGRRITLLQDSVITISGQKLTGLTSDELLQYKKNISLCANKISGVTIPTDDSTIVTIDFLSRAKQNNRYVEVLREYVKQSLAKNELTNIIFIAGKGAGKSTLIDVIKEQKIGKITFIEDSDDYGQWLTYLAITYNQPNILELKISHADAIKEVGNFYDLKSQGCKYVSYFNSYMESYITHMLNNLGGEKLSDYKIMEMCLTMNLDNIRSYITKINSAEGLSQRFFNDGITVYAKSLGKRIHLAFLHTYLDNSKRDNQVEAVQIDFMLDSFTNLLVRAERNRLTSVEYLADITLKRLWDEVREGSIPRMSLSNALYTLGLVPVLHADLKISIQSDMWIGDSH